MVECGMIIFEKEVVIHVTYGGFHFNDEMALWLMENRNWKIGKEDKKEFDLYDYSNDYLFLTGNRDNREFRDNQDLIDCVKALKELHKNDDYMARQNSHINGLAVVKVKVHLEIEDVYDGVEKVSCWVESV